MIVKNPYDELSKPNMELNRLEHYLLKLVIPFLRIGHCTRGRYLRLQGQLIMVSADLVSTMEKIVPIKQNLIPVSFKRKLEYQGYYIQEYIDKEKVTEYFNFLRTYNHLYEDIELGDLSKFDEETQAEILSSPSEPSVVKEEKFHPGSDNNSEESSEEDSDEEELVSFEPGHIPMGQSSIIRDKYKESTEAPTVANKMASMIFDFEKMKKMTDDDEDIDDPEAVIFHEDEADDLEDDTHFLEKLRNIDIKLEDKENMEIVSKLEICLINNKKDSDHYCSLLKNLGHLLATEDQLSNMKTDNKDLEHFISDVKKHTEKEKENIRAKLDSMEKCCHNDEDDNEDHSFFDEILENNSKTEETLKETRNFVMSQVTQIKKNLEKIISVAPGEGGDLKSWGSDVFLEEKLFPQLFPYGIGGYLSSNLLKNSNMGFSNYCKNRILSVDSKYRRDPAYLCFLLTVKELLEMRRSEKTFFRMAAKVPNLTQSIISDLSPEFFKRYNQAFTTFKHLRGTAFYYQDVKKRLMAFLRQKGGPTLFITFSAAEFEWTHLALKIYETITKRPSTIDFIESQSISWRNKLIQENVVQSTIHFSKRMDKIIAFLNSKPLLVHNGVKFGVASYFYRIEFQVIFVVNLYLMLFL